MSRSSRLFDLIFTLSFPYGLDEHLALGTSSFQADNAFPDRYGCQSFPHNFPDDLRGRQEPKLRNRVKIGQASATAQFVRVAQAVYPGAFELLRRLASRHFVAPLAPGCRRRGQIVSMPVDRSWG